MNPIYQNTILLQHGCRLASDLGQKVRLPPPPAPRSSLAHPIFCWDAKHQELPPSLVIKPFIPALAQAGLAEDLFWPFWLR